MAASPIRRLTAILVVSLALAGCEEGQNPLAGLAASLPGGTGGAETADGAPAAASGAVVERDVESPSTFTATDQGLWDGRPSLGGVWVAHPSATSPERVVIRNPSTGKETTGALFRRERDMPGPRIQVSSDAAAALGMVAGSPVELTVVAIVRERTPVAPPPSATGEALATGGIEAAPLAPGATAAAAVATVAATPAPAPTSTDRPASRPARSAAAPATPAPAASAPATPAPATPAPAAATPAPAPAAPAAPATAAAPATPAAPAATALQAPLAGGSFIQVGIFSQESNAEGTAATLRDAGIVPGVRQQESNGKTVWRVLVGPVSTASDRAALLDKVRELGFADAYVIRN